MHCNQLMCYIILTYVKCVSSQLTSAVSGPNNVSLTDALTYNRNHALYCL